MTIVSSIVLFQVIWWIVFLCALPVGVRIDPHPKKGMAASAPLNPHIWRKIWATTFITCILWGLAYAVIKNQWISIM